MFAAETQHCLDLEPDNVACKEIQTAPEVDLIDSILHHHSGDYRAAITSLLLDADFLRDQLAIASCIMSKGMGRGWRPKYERL